MDISDNQKWVNIYRQEVERDKMTQVWMPDNEKGS